MNSIAELHLIDPFELLFVLRSLQRYNYTAQKIKGYYWQLMETNDTLVHMLTGTLLSNNFTNIFRHQSFYMLSIGLYLAWLYFSISSDTLQCCTFPFPKEIFTIHVIKS